MVSEIPKTPLALLDSMQSSTWREQALHGDSRNVIVLVNMLLLRRFKSEREAKNERSDPERVRSALQARHVRNQLQVPHDLMDKDRSAWIETDRSACSVAMLQHAAEFHRFVFRDRMPKYSDKKDADFDH
jgi:hypothetical protein